MSRTSRRRREQLSRVARRLPPEQGGAIILVGFIYSFSVLGLQIALGAELASSIRRAWRERQRGPASAVRAGLTPRLIGLVGAIAIQEVVKAAAFRVILDPALNSAEPDPSPCSR